MKVVRMGIVLLQLAAVSAVGAQTMDDVSITVKGVTLATNGGEESGIALFAGPVTMGTPTTGTFWSRGCGLMGVSSGSRPSEGAIVEWRVEITPIRVVEDAVTFRLRWGRTLDRNTPGFGRPSEDIQLTLKPGESRPIDSVPVPTDGATLDGGPCKIKSTSLRVSADIYPMEEWERRLIAADLWLIERVSRGGERSQSVAVRGLPNRSIPFYFDSIKDGNDALDILGHLIARPEEGAIEILLRTRSRWGPSSFDWRTSHALPSRWIDSTLRVKTGEIVEVRLPALGESAGTFSTRTFSIRVRARQLR